MSPDAPQLQQKLSAFASRAGDVAPKCDSEATTKSYLIAPYLDEILGYNPHNPDHCVPEYSADIKGAGDKVDYALLHNDKPIIIVEAKSIGSIQTNHATPGQLNGYFVGCEATFAALTDGLIWNWYRARPRHYQLEDAPFLSHDVRNPNPIELHWLLSIVNQANFDPNQASREAMAVKMKAAFLHWLHTTRENPSDEFLTFLTKETQSENTDIETVKTIFVNAFNSLSLDKPPLPMCGPTKHTDPQPAILVLEDGTNLHSSQWQRAWRPAGEPWRVCNFARTVYVGVCQHLADLDKRGADAFYAQCTLSRGEPFFPRSEEHSDAMKKLPNDWKCVDQTTDRWLRVAYSAETMRRRIQRACQQVDTSDGRPIVYGEDIQVWLPTWTQQRE